ncbi:MAG: hypothetical protein ACRET8_05435 [Burkholderiales bacterium]
MEYLVAVLVSVASFAAAAQAPANPPVRIRGTVDKLDGAMLTVKTRDGQSAVIKLADNTVVMGVVKASPADIDTTKFIGTTTVGERDGAMVALEVHIFPESMRGAGEGHRDWDLRPNSKMTNAAVASVTAMGKDRVMTVQYKNGEKKVLVTDSTAVVSYAPSDRGALKPGAPVFINSQKHADGSLATNRVNVGLNGQAPPM